MTVQDFDLASNDEAYKLTEAPPADAGSALDPESAKQLRKLEKVVKRDNKDTARRFAS